MRYSKVAPPGTRLPLAVLALALLAGALMFLGVHRGSRAGARSGASIAAGQRPATTAARPHAKR